ncbi:hypothetical protein KKB44_05500 [Candidatus Micrarchaeota archaeon]|nr:hypothetical protein [Candidatus Micrarchaeota archaeon]
MFVSFEPLIFLFWVFLSSFIPGALLSLSIFRKDDFLFIEKALIGCALGLIILPLIPFLFYFILGITYSYNIALLSIVLLYIIAAAFFVKNKVYEDLSIPKLPSINLEKFEISNTAIISIILLVLVILSFMVRMGSYSPIFQELDPYYYTYTAQQLLIFGENPEDDQTAWYPEVEVNHRTIPALSYLESIWYSLYTSGGEYSHMLLALIASMYPPIMAAFAVFFIYLFVSVASKREWGLISAGLVTFIPIFILKLSAGEQEVQPYAFFSLTFFYAMYVLSIMKKDLRFSALAGLGFAAVALGSSSQILAMISVLLFLILHSIILFLRDKDESELRYLTISNAIIFVIGPLLGSAILKDIFEHGYPALSMVIPFFVAVAFCGLLYFLKQKIPDRQRASLILAVIIVFGLIVIAVTPIGTYITSSAKSAFGIAEFKVPLQRTIAEQNLAASSLAGHMGFIAEEYTDIISILLTPITAVLKLGSQDVATNLEQSLGWLFSSIFLLVSVPVNILLALFVGAVNLVLGTDVAFTEKSNSLLLFWMLTFWITALYSVFKFIKKEEINLSILMLTFIMPAFVVGIIKAKYTIYSAVLLTIAIGFSLGEIDRFFKGKFYKILLAIGIFLVLLQFTYNGFAPSLIWGSIQPLYQNNPEALVPKFEQFCTQTGDPDVCAAALDPLAYADLGTNYQYNQKLCMLSLFSNYSSLSTSTSTPTWESQAAMFRCQRLSTYWIDSMEWIRENTPNDSRTTSWWDYGHWINFFGQRNTVLRNEHKSHEMIGAVADGYLSATPEELKQWMQEHDSEYALFDMELIHSGSTLGGKYGALNYLSCAWNNETTVANQPGTSQCEADHLWETAYVSNHQCTISELSNKTGTIAYKVYVGDTYIPYYPSNCMEPKTANDIVYCRDYVTLVPTYCVGEVTLATGDVYPGTYYLNETNPNGDLKLNKAFLQLPFQLPTTSHIGPAIGTTLFYTNDALWLENGVVTSGYEDRKGKFYDSNIYNALFLNTLPGFELVYTAPGGAVKIYKITD